MQNEMEALFQKTNVSHNDIMEIEDTFQEAGVCQCKEHNHGMTINNTWYDYDEIKEYFP